MLKKQISLTGVRASTYVNLRNMSRIALLPLLVLCFIFTTACHSANSPESSGLDYDAVIWLDAEALAEGAIAEVYDLLAIELQSRGVNLDPIHEDFDGMGSRYAVTHADTEYVIFDSHLDDADGAAWGRATYALFSIVNQQLVSNNIQFYAINGGHDLGGLFLTPEQFEAARASLPDTRDWPYLPTLEHPHYGMNW